MLEEQSLLLEATTLDAGRAAYVSVVVDDNCLGKRTVSNRRLSLQRLTELYGLDRRRLLFRVLRDLWELYDANRPLLAVLLALARDPLLRATASTVLDTPYSHQLARQAMTDAVSRAAGERLNPASVDKVVRNAASSWTQSGHLYGRSRKVRQRVHADPACAAYALLIGFATGMRGHALFETPWCAVLDAEAGELMELAQAARSVGLLELKQSGPIIDVSFATMLAGTGRGRIRGTYRHAG